MQGSGLSPLMLLYGNSCSPIFPFFHCIRKTYTTDSGRLWGCWTEKLKNKGKNEWIALKTKEKLPSLFFFFFFSKCLCIFGSGGHLFRVMKGRLTSWRPRACSRAIDQGLYGDHQPRSCNTRLSRSVPWMLGSSVCRFGMKFSVLLCCVSSLPVKMLCWCIWASSGNGLGVSIQFSLIPWENIWVTTSVCTGKPNCFFPRSSGHLW